MRLTQVIINESPAFINPLREREISIRGYKIPAIENLGATLDQFDVIDLSDNEIQKVENFPVLQRLRKLMISNNHVNRISEKLSKELPNLTTLILTNNRITNLSVIDALDSNKNLIVLSLLDNPVCRRPNYRLYVIAKVPSLQVLDFQKISKKERDAAKKMFPPATAGATIAPGEPEEETKEIGLKAPEPVVKPTPEQITALRATIANANTPAEIERLERALRAGIIPEGILSKPAATTAAAAAPQSEDPPTKRQRTEGPRE